MPLLIGKPESDSEIVSKLNQYTKDYNWVKDNYEALLEKHGEKYIAVKNQNVVAVADNIKELTEKLKKQKGDPTDYVVEFLTKKVCNYLF